MKLAARWCQAGSEEINPKNNRKNILKSDTVSRPSTNKIKAMAVREDRSRERERRFLTNPSKNKRRKEFLARIVVICKLFFSSILTQMNVLSAENRAHFVDNPSRKVWWGSTNKFAVQEFHLSIRITSITNSQIISSLNPTKSNLMKKTSAMTITPSEIYSSLETIDPTQETMDRSLCLEQSKGLTEGQ